MDHAKVNAALGTVHAAQSAQEVAEAYAAWAARYDRETAELGYVLPFLIAAWIGRYVPPGAGPLLDAGCGTGLSGPYLQALGYRDIDGLDLSEEMLAVAAGRKAYRTLTRAALGEPLPWPNGHFEASFATGVFTMGHAPASALYELARITRPGGHVIFTVREQAYFEGGYQAVLADLVRQGIWSAAEDSPWFRCYAVGDPQALVKCFVYTIV